MDTPRTHMGREMADWPMPCSWRQGSLVMTYPTKTQWDLARPSQTFTFATTNAREELVHVCTGLGQTKYIYEKNFPRPQCERQELTMPQRTLITPEAGSIWWEIENKEKELTA